MRALVRFTLLDGSPVELGPGDVIGRLYSAALQLDDAAISEAHAMVSLRGEALVLLALRGRLAVDGVPASRVTLAAGQRVHLSRELSLQVEEVQLPTRVLALEGDDLPRQVLHGVCSLTVKPRPSLVPRYEAHADARLWSDGDGFKLRLGVGEAVAIGPGQSFTVRGRTFTAVPLALGEAARSATRVGGRLQQPLHIVAHYDSVHIQAEPDPPVSFSGVPARLISELVAIGGPVPWRVLAREVWGQEEDGVLRRRLDVNLSRIRKRLREGGVRADLVRADGYGQVELYRYEGDVVEDRT